MRTRWIPVVVGAVALLAWVGPRAFSEDEEGGKEPSMEEVMEQLATPGEMHAWLAQSEGEWDIATEMSCPDGTMSKEKGTATIRMVLGGRFQEQILKGTFQGKPFEGRGLTGYDNLSQTFQNYWFDTMGTAPSVATGQRSEDGRTLTFTGSWPMPGGAMPFRFILNFESKDRFTFTMKGTMEEEEQTLMTSVYTRK